MLTNASEWSERSIDLSRLLGRAGLGDRAAFATLYERTSAHLFAVVLRINRDRGEAEDAILAQDGSRGNELFGIARAAAARPGPN